MLRRLVIACSLLLAACGAPSTEAPPPAVSPSAEAPSGEGALEGAPSAEASSGALGCVSHKLRFEQATGCFNDGSVEFCLDAADNEAREAVRAIAPEADCAQGSRGRAGCDVGRELLCLVEIGEAECTARHGALTDVAYAKLCDLAALGAVRQIVPTFYE